VLQQIQPGRLKHATARPDGRGAVLVDRPAWARQRTHGPPVGPVWSTARRAWEGGNEPLRSIVPGAKCSFKKREATLEFRSATFRVLPSFVLIHSSVFSGLEARDAMGRSLFIVSRTKPGTYTYLKLVSDSEDVEVVLDRRELDRRRIEQRVTPERRQPAPNRI
jgi:hypothetical protein